MKLDPQSIIGEPKAVLYLDQFVISNITKVLDPDFSRRERIIKEAPFWLELYQKLDRLLKLQLIVCPDSYYHRTESMISNQPSFEELQDVYTYLSNDCTFQDDAATLRWQVLHHFRCYVEGHPDQEPKIPAGDLISGDPNEWQGRIRVTVPLRSNTDEVASLRDLRVKQHSHLNEIFKRWQFDKTSFHLSVEEEAQALGAAIIEVFVSHLKQQLLYEQGLAIPESPLAFLPPPAAAMVYDLFHVLDDYAVRDPLEQLKRVSDYLRSPYFLQVPFVRLSSMLYASIARKVQAGKLSPPNQGTVTDVTAIGALLPYCQAMFLDNEMAGYLREAPLNNEVEHFGTRIFALNTKQEFLTYLDGIECQAGARHVAFIKMIYGESWLKPFMGVVTQGRKARERRGRTDDG